MKYFITLCATALILTSCGKKDESAKAPPADSVDKVADSLHKAIADMQNTHPKTPREALDALIALPRGGPFPPHLLPVKDITPLEHTDSTAAFAITSGSTPAKGKVVMKRVVNGNETDWVMSHVEDLK